MNTRDKVWDLIYDLMPEPYDMQLPLYEGVSKWENEINDIVSDIEGLAIMLETHIDEKARYEAERKKGEE